MDCICTIMAALVRQFNRRILTAGGWWSQLLLGAKKTKLSKNRQLESFLDGRGRHIVVSQCDSVADFLLLPPA
jgi:hypothetical protein